MKLARPDPLRRVLGVSFQQTGVSVLPDPTATEGSEFLVSVQFESFHRYVDRDVLSQLNLLDFHAVHLLGPVGFALHQKPRSGVIKPPSAAVDVKGVITLPC